MTDNFPRPMGRDDQPTDALSDERLEEMPEHETDDVIPLGAGMGTTGGDANDDSGLLPTAVEFDDNERFDVDDARKPGIDDYTD